MDTVIYRKMIEENKDYWGKNVLDYLNLES